MLLIDHNMALVMEVCDRIQVLDRAERSQKGHPRTCAGTSTSPQPTSGKALFTKTCPMATSEAMLEVSGLEVRYGSVPAVEASTSAWTAVRSWA